MGLPALYRVLSLSRTPKMSECVREVMMPARKLGMDGRDLCYQATFARTQSDFSLSYSLALR